MDIVKRLTVEDIYSIKLEYLRNLGLLKSIHEKIGTSLKQINGYFNYYLENKTQYKFKENGDEKQIDYYCWNYLVGLYGLQKYMLCTEYKKMMKEIMDGETPVFNPVNAVAWLEGLKALIYENVKQMIKTVFENLTTKRYETGNRQIKKRNNNGIDKNFILTTSDYRDVHGYYRYSFGDGGVSVTDDLEKVCYLLDGKKLPEITIKMQLKNNSTTDNRCVIAENDYFRIKICQNGNTHYTLNDNIREKLNRLGASPGTIGENIKIKEFDTWR